MIKNIYKALAPPIIQSKIKSFIFKRNGYFSGPYANWNDASNEAEGYCTQAIFEKIKKATLIVKNNENLYVRDGIIFEKPQYSYPLLACLLKVAVENRGHLHVLDFGGGLGSTYYAFKNFCQNTICVQWSIIEQNHFVECGKNFFADENLKFYYDSQELTFLPDIILLSGTLQYLESPFVWLERFLTLKVPYLLLDRTWFDTARESDEILVEHVPEHIYRGSYPCWKFSYQKISKYLTSHFNVLCEFDALEGTFISNQFKIASKGIFLRRKDL